MLAVKWHKAGWLTNIRPDGAVACVDQQLPVGLFFRISSQTVDALQERAVVWIICVGEAVQDNSRWLCEGFLYSQWIRWYTLKSLSQLNVIMLWWIHRKTTLQNLPNSWNEPEYFTVDPVWTGCVCVCVCVRVCVCDGVNSMSGLFPVVL